jgi:hypothetical protein
MYLGRGGNCRVYTYPGKDTHVIKICKRSCLSLSFKELTSLSSLPFPIGSATLLSSIVLHVGKKYFHYTQPRLTHCFKYNGRDARAILKLLLFLYEQGYVLVDIGSQNFRRNHQGRLACIDYHEIPTLKQAQKKYARCKTKEASTVFSFLCRYLYSYMHGRDLIPIVHRRYGGSMRSHELFLELRIIQNYFPHDMFANIEKMSETILFSDEYFAYLRNLVMQAARKTK